MESEVSDVVFLLCGIYLILVLYKLFYIIALKYIKNYVCTLLLQNFDS